MFLRSLAYVVAVAVASSVYAPSDPPVEKPAALVADGVPPVPQSLAERTRPYMEYRTAVFQDWHPQDRSMLITTRFGNTAQVHRVAMPSGARTQLSFEADRIALATWAPTRGDVLLVQKDVGGNEFFQLYTLRDGRLRLLTDGASRNQFNTWSDDGVLIAYTSTRRNGVDNDLYVMDPRDPSTDRRVAEVKGGGWVIASFAPDRKRAAVLEYVSITKTNLHLLDLESGTLRPIGDHRRQIAYGKARFAPDGTLWVTSDEGSEFLRLGTIDLHSGKFMPRTPDTKWDVEEFDIAADGAFIAYVTNEAGISRLKLLDLKTDQVRVVETPRGLIEGLAIAPWGEIGVSISSAKSSTDAFSIDPTSARVTRWTMSETGGLDVTQNVEPELIEVKSFDGTLVSGFLYRPDPAKFPGKRPLIISIHGGPESQFRPTFLGRSNYLLNELGIALFFPNVRGSAGYGKTFMSLDNGPFKREDSVRDIGAFLERLRADPALDATRFGVMGASYGGYMCYASAIRYGEYLRAANCIVAISNFVTFLENTQGYRRDLRRVEYGDERDPTQRAKLLEISPLTSVDKLNIPLFVVTGGNDPRVPASEAEQMVRAVREKGGLAWHLLGQDEGHGFAKKVNQDYQFWAALLFWEQTLLD